MDYGTLRAYKSCQGELFKNIDGLIIKRRNQLLLLTWTVHIQTKHCAIYIYCQVLDCFYIVLVTV